MNRSLVPATWVAAALLVVTACDGVQSGPPTIGYTIEAQDGIHLRHEGGAGMDSAELLFVARSGRPVNCSVSGERASHVELSGEGQYLLLAISPVASGLDVHVSCPSGVDLNFRSSTFSNAATVVHTLGSAEEDVALHASNRLWVIFTLGMIGLMVLSFIAAILMNKVFGRLANSDA
jgi:hypothetical protein